MNCPCCGGELKRGFVQCRDGLHWTPRQQIVPALSALGKDARILHNDDNLRTGTVHALYCSACGMVFIPREGDPLLK